MDHLLGHLVCRVVAFASCGMPSSRWFSSLGLTLGSCAGGLPIPVRVFIEEIAIRAVRDEAAAPNENILEEVATHGHEICDKATNDEKPCTVLARAEKADPQPGPPLLDARIPGVAS